MDEKCFNLFLFVTDDLIHEFGAVAHQLRGTDEQKIARLQALVDADYRTAKRYPVPDWCIAVADGGEVKGWLSYDAFLAAQSIGKHFDIIEPIFQDLGASQSPLIVITPVVNGRPRIDAVTDLMGNPKG